MARPSSPPSRESEEWTSGSNEPDGASSPRPRQMSTAGPSSPNGSPGCHAPLTSAIFNPYRTIQKDGTVVEGFAEREVVDALHGPTGNKEPLVVVDPTSSAAASPARTSRSPDAAPASPGSGPACSSPSPTSPTLFDPGGYSSRTYPGCSPRTAVGTSESCLERWPTSGTAWDGGFSTAASSECPSADGACSSSQVTLADVLEPSAPARYSLSARAARGILRRAEKRGRDLPEALRMALLRLSEATPAPAATATGSSS